MLLTIGLLFSILILYGNPPDSVKLKLDFPVFDWPHQYYAAKTTGSFLKGYANPSMAQSLSLSNNLYYAGHYGIRRSFENVRRPFWRKLGTRSAIAAFDILSTYLPFGYAWLHEEYHRAVLTRREANSFNGIYRFPVGQDVVAVSHVRDEDLERIADYHQPDFRRLQTAGIEGQLHQVQSLQKSNFYHHKQLPHLMLYWLSVTNNAFYVLACSSDTFDALVDKMNERDGATISNRDFTGPDFTAWADALFYPEKPYAHRGTHPSGVGYNRYIKPSQLTNEARDYLKKQGVLQFINFLSPMMFGKERIRLKSSYTGNHYGNFAFRHMLTPFGYDLSMDLFYQGPQNNLFFAVHNYHNRHKSFWGIESMVLNRALTETIYTDIRIMLWQQPEALSFDAKKGQTGSLLGFRAHRYAYGRISPFIELEAKSTGWVMGNVFLQPNFSLRAGFSFIY